MTTTLSLVPLFGTCVNSVNLESRCVLTASSCASTETYVPGLEGDVHCLATDIVAGRCTSTLDDNRCAATVNACSYKLQFVELDPTCTAVSDLVTAATTSYPGCWDPFSATAGTNDVCALDESYCIAGENLNAAKWQSEWAEVCVCDDVPVGVCYTNGILSSGNFITPTNSFCATSSSDCPSASHSFMGAREFKEHNLAYYQCHLCDVRSPFAAGSCRSSQSQTDVNCALEASECTSENSIFVSSSELMEEGLQCLVSDTDLKFGRCMSNFDSIDCTNKRESCLFPTLFEPSSTCNMYENANSNFPTYFPFCSPDIGSGVDWRDIRCVWDSSECDTTTERFEEAKVPEDGFEGCLCEHVFTGVCEYTPGKYRCAVSAEACADQSTYIPQRSLAENGINENLCPLCPTRSSPAPTAAPVSPVASPIASPTPAPVVSPVASPIASPTFAPVAPAAAPTASPVTLPTMNDDSTSENPFNSESKGSGLSTGAVIGIAVGVAAVMLIFSVVCGFTKFSRNQPSTSQQKDVENPENDTGLEPPTTVGGEVSEEFVENKQGTML